ncbi:hypothetical protein BDR04DRAFT_1148867, partial [Suillus decipiens]
ADLVQTQWDESWLQIHGVRNLQTPDEQDWLQTQAGRYWLQTQAGCYWLQTQAGRGWLESHAARKYLQTLGRRDWPQTRSGGSWLLTLHGRRWLQTQSGEDWLQTQSGQDWLQTQCGQDWLQILGGEDWLQIEGGRGWLQAEGGRKWLQAEGGRKWLQTEGGQDWLRDWLLTPRGQAWRLTTTWVTIEEFWSTLGVLREYIIATDMRSHPAFQVIQQFKNLPDFLMFPAFLALRYQDHSPATSLHGHLSPNIEIIHAMKVFSSFAYEVWEESQSASDILNYACQNWVVHLSRAPDPWDEKLSHIFQSFWDHNLLSWLSRQWCLKDLRSCLAILSEGEKIAKHTKRRTTGYFFATLVYQLAINFPSIRGDMNRIILDNPALLDHHTSLCDQMEVLLLRPLRSLQFRLHECQPLTFVIDALDECASESPKDDTSESEIADLYLPTW